MHDQAIELRRLVRERALPVSQPRAQRPRLLAVTGGKGGVGTTTMAVNLAVALAQTGLSTVLVDADPQGGDVATLCGLEPRYTLTDVLTSERTVLGALEPGPGPIRILAGAWGWEQRCDDPPAAARRVLEQLDALGGAGDLIVLDAGNGPSRAWQTFLQRADLIVSVTTAATTSILDTYASIKTQSEIGVTVPVYVLVNRVPSREVARDVQRRLALACSRFVGGIRLQQAGHVAEDPAVAAAAEPFTIGRPDSPAASSLRRLTQTVAADRQGSQPKAAAGGIHNPSRKHSKLQEKEKGTEFQAVGCR